MPIVARDVSYQYVNDGPWILSHLHLDIAPGRVTALCGAARSGRSTALALLAGLSKPTAGTVTADGLLVASHEARGRVGLLLQNADEALFGLTVLDDAMFGPLQLGCTEQEARRRADASLRTVHLEPAQFASRSPFSLSGGQRKRAAIAGLMAMEPTYVLLDEPFVGLDPVGRDETVETIRSIATQGFGRHTGVLVALHSLELALALADEIVILSSGTVAWRGSTSSYISAPPDPTPWNLHQPDLVAVLSGLRDSGWALEVDDAEAASLAQAIICYKRRLDD